MDTIERVPLKADAVGIRNAVLAEKSRKLLGYEPRMRVHGVLARALETLGISPLNIHDVRAYKAKKAKVFLSNNTRMMLFAVAFFALVEAVAVVLRAWVFDPIISVSGLVVLVTVGIITIETDKIQRIREWGVMAIEDYSGDIPDFALSKATEIKELVPGARFAVEYLYERIEVTRRPLPDPFLVVTLPGECFYLDVWEEPEFERKL